MLLEKKNLDQKEDSVKKFVEDLKRIHIGIKKAPDTVLILHHKDKSFQIDFFKATNIEDRDRNPNPFGILNKDMDLD